MFALWPPPRRRSGASGFLLPLSGGADSSATAAIVGTMCQLAVAAAAAGDSQVAADTRRIGQYPENAPIPNAKDLADKIFTTVYMGTVNSSGETCGRSKKLAEEIGSYHMDVRIDPLVTALLSLFAVRMAAAIMSFVAPAGGRGLPC